MTIFGFNTDVKRGDTIYHVQSEARSHEQMVQTLVFVKGQCVGKRAVSYSKEVSKPDFSEQAIHELLKAQHRTIIDAINAGTVESALATPAEVEDTASSGMSLKCTKAGPISDSGISMRFQVTDAGKAAADAELTFRVGATAGAPVIAYATCDNTGQAEMQIPITDELRRESAITVQAKRGNKTVTRKFRFKGPDQ